MTRKEKQEKFEELVKIDILRAFYVKYGIKKDPKLDNTAYYPVYKSDKRYNVIYGGRGSGKSYEIEGKMPLVLISCLPFCRILMIRKVYRTVETSMFQELVDYIEKWNLNKFFKVRRGKLRVTHIQSGNYIDFGGMDKPATFKSVKDVTHVIFGEAYNIDDEEGISKIDKSVRTPRLKKLGCHGVHKIFYVFNPDNKDHHIYTNFFCDDTENETSFEFKRKNSFILKTTYKNNRFVPKIFVDLLKADKKANPERWKVDGLGEFGDIKKTGLYYPKFDFDDQVKKGLKDLAYDESKPLHVTFDFNVFPYITLNVHLLHFNEEENQLEACQIDEICLNEKDNDPKHVGDVEETCKEFIRRYSKHRGNVIVHGDRSGHNRKTNAVSDYATVFKMLRSPKKRDMIKRKDNSERTISFYLDNKCTFKVIDQTIKTQNPRHEVRKLLFRRLQAGTLVVAPATRKLSTINARGQTRQLSKDYGNIKIVQLIDSSCKFSIKDYQNVVIDQVKGDKSSRDKYLTHASDANDYFFTSVFDVEYNIIKTELSR